MTIPAGWYPDPENRGGQRFWDGSGWTDQRTPAPTAAPPPPPPLPPPSAPEPVTPPTAIEHPPLDSFAPISGGYGPAHAAPPDSRKQLIRNYGIGVGVGFLLVIVTTLWASFSSPGRTEVNISGPSVSTSVLTPTEDTEASDASDPDTPTSAPPASGNEVVNAGLSFVVDTVELTSSVTSPDNEYLTADANGEFVVVYLSISNVGNETMHYMAAQQRLTADGVAYEPDQATSYFLGNIYEELQPGASTQTALVFDVPAGAVPQSLELHGDAVSPGSTITLE